MNIRAGVAVVALSIFSSVALAQSLKDKEYFADQEKYLAGEVTTTNERCANSLTAKFDWLKPPVGGPEDLQRLRLLRRSARGHAAGL